MLSRIPSLADWDRASARPAGDFRPRPALIPIDRSVRWENSQPSHRNGSGGSRRLDATLWAGAFSLVGPAAIEAVKQWRYKPFLLNGQPLEVETTVTVDFHLHSE